MSLGRTKASEPESAVKTVNLALQGGGSHGAYVWGVIDALSEEERIEIGAISGASAGAINAAVYATGLAEGGRQGARAKLEKFWLSVSTEGSLGPAQRRFVDAWANLWGRGLPGSELLARWADAASQFVSPYAFNPFNINPLRAHLVAAVDFERLRAGESPKLFVAATNVRTGRGEIFRRDVLTADHIMASCCLPQLFQAVEIGREAYWDGGYAGNPPLWPLFYETKCRDIVIVQINPIERAEIPRTPEDIANRLNEITFNASLLAELRAADFVARLIRSGILNSDGTGSSACTGSAAPAGSKVSRPRPSSTSPGPFCGNCATWAAPTRRPGSRRISTRSASKAPSTSTGRSSASRRRTRSAGCRRRDDGRRPASVQFRGRAWIFNALGVPDCNFRGPVAAI